MSEVLLSFYVAVCLICADCLDVALNDIASGAISVFIVVFYAVCS